MTTPLLARDRAQLQAALKGADAVGFVPTMGALHAGHASLMDRAREEVGAQGVVVVSVFVNPTQFAPGEDLDRYPRTLEADIALCAEHGVDVVFAPSVEEIYPSPTVEITVDPGPLATELEGASRPTHFRGVLTVVAKLFGLVRPDVAVFGQKDYQQLVLITRMASDLCMGVRVVGAETVREDDGLAMSSRNRYLSTEDRRASLALSQALLAAKAAAGAGAASALDAAREVLHRTPAVDLDYLELTAPDLGPAPDFGEARMLVAARVGTTRLIDNVALDLGRASATNEGDR